MKKLLSVLAVLTGLMLSSKAQPVLPSTPYTRGLLRTVDQTTAQSYLGITGGTNGIYAQTNDPRVISLTNKGNFWVGSLSNANITASQFMPTNTYAGTGTASATINTHTITSAGQFGNLRRGDNILFGAEQYTIVGIASTSSVTVYEPIISTHTNAAYNVFPVAAALNDVNGNPAGYIGNDGSIGIIGNVGDSPEPANSAKFFWNNGLHSFASTVKSEVDGIRLEFGSVSNGTIFAINEGAPFDSLRVLPDGSVSTKYGFTNNPGITLQLLGPVNSRSSLSVQSNFSIGSSMSYAGTNSVTPANLISYTNNTHTIVTSNSAFAGLVPGTGIGITGVNLFTLESVVNNNTITVFEPLQGTALSHAWFYVPPAIITSNTTPVQTYFLSPDGSIGLFQSGEGSSSRIMFINGGDDFYQIIRNESDGWRFEIETPSNGPPFSINETAPFDSLHVLSDGSVYPKIGITGSEPVGSSNTAGGNLIVLGGPSTGSGSEGQIIFKTTGSGAASTNQALNSQVERFRVNTNGANASQWITSNTNQFSISTTGWTNTNNFDCVLYVLSASATIANYTDGTNTIISGAGIGSASFETWLMHPAYTFTYTSGAALSGKAIAQ